MRATQMGLTLCFADRAADNFYRRAGTTLDSHFRGNDTLKKKPGVSTELFLLR